MFLYFRYLNLFNFYAIFSFLMCLFLIFNKSIFYYQWVYTVFHFYFFNISWIFGFDFPSYCLSLLTIFLLSLCFLIYWYLRYRFVLYVILLFSSLFFFLNAFISLDFLFFYVFFEGLVIPMFLIVGIWGSRVRKLYAAYQLFLYTLFGSIFMLICFISIFSIHGSSSIDFFLHSYFFAKREFLLWVLLFLGFSVKIPILPFHIWLPEAHVEAPTPGSVILAGLILKLGTYSMVRLLLTNWFFVLSDLILFIFIIALFGLIYPSILALAQLDMKKVIAYSSIAHMNFSLFGLFSNHAIGIVGAFSTMLGHAFTASALFFSIGILYDRYKTRLLFHHGGIVYFLPIFCILYFIFSLANFGFPGTLNFVGEFLTIIGGLSVSSYIIFFSLPGMIFTLIYTLFMYNRICFGGVSSYSRYFADVSIREFFILVLLVILILGFGLYPNILCESVYPFVQRISII